MADVNNMLTSFLGSGAGSSSSSGLELITKDTTPQTISSDSTEQTIFTYNVPANAMGTTGGYKLTIFGDHLNNTGDATSREFTLRVKYGATTLYADPSPSSTTNASRRGQKYEFFLFNTGATNAQTLTGQVMYGTAGGATTGTTGDLSAPAVGNNPIVGTATEDSTAQKAFAVTVQYATANAQLVFRKHLAILEKF